MPLKHDKLIRLIGEFGYPTNEEGMCFGYAVIGMQAMLANDLDTFTARMEFIDDQLKTKTTKQFVNELKNIEQQRVKLLKENRENFLNNLGQNIGMTDSEFYAFLKQQKNKFLESMGKKADIDDKEFYALLNQYKENELAKYYAFRTNLEAQFDPRLLDVRAFLELVTLYYRPKIFPDLFDKNATPNRQNAELTFIRGLPTHLVEITSHVREEKSSGKRLLEHYKEESLVKKTGSFAGLYNIDELAIFFNLLHSQSPDAPDASIFPLSSPGFNPPITFLLRSGNHAISVVFDNKTNCWLLFDANKMPVVRCKTDADIAQHVLSSLSMNGITTFRTEMFCTKDQENEVKKWFSKVTKTSQWENLHKIDGKERLTDSKNYSLLQNAIWAEDIAIIEELVKSNNTDLNQISQKSKSTPLSLAVGLGNVQIVRALLKSPKIELNKKTKNTRKTPLHTAAANGNVEVIKALLELDINPNKHAMGGDTPLHLAASEGHIEAVKALLESPNVEPNAKNIFGETLFHLAAKKGHVELIKILIENPKIELNAKSIYGETPLDLAVTKGQADVVNVFLKKDPNLVNKILPNGKSLLQFAIEKKHVNLIKILLQTPKINIKKPNANGDTIFHLAAEIGDVEVYKALLLSLQSNESKFAPDKENFDKKTPLHCAAEKGHANIVKLLIENNQMELTNRDIYKNTPLHLAVINGHAEVVRVILAKHPDLVTQALPNGKSLLRFALEKGYTKVIVELLSNPDVVRTLLNNDPNLTNERFVSQKALLSIAVEKGMVDIVNILLEKDPNLINQPLSDGKNLFRLAVEKNQVAVVNAFLKKYPKIINESLFDGKTMFRFAAEEGHADIVRLLLEKDPTLTHALLPDLFKMACKKGYAGIVKIFFEKDPSLLVNAKSLLRYAVEEAHAGIVRTLLERDPNLFNLCDGKALLKFAIDKGYANVVKALLENRKLDSNTEEKYDVTPLIRAVLKGQADVVRALLQNTKIKLNKKDTNGWTPLHLAASMGHVEVVNALLESNKINPDLENNKEETPLHIAAAAGHTEVVKAMYKSHKVLLNQEDENGNTPLHRAASEGKVEVIKVLLLSARIEPNLKNMNGLTPLHLAIIAGQSDVVKLLLQNSKINVNKKDKDGRTPFHRAIYEGHAEVVKAFLEHDPSLMNQQFEMTPAKSRKADVKPLLESKKNNEEDLDDRLNPFYLAINLNHSEIVRVFVEHGYPIYKKMHDKNALQYAAHKPGILKIMKDAAIDDMKNMLWCLIEYLLVKRSEKDPKSILLKKLSTLINNMDSSHGIEECFKLLTQICYQKTSFSFSNATTLGTELETRLGSKEFNNLLEFMFQSKTVDLQKYALGENSTDHFKSSNCNDNFIQISEKIDKLELTKIKEDAQQKEVKFHIVENEIPIAQTNTTSSLLSRLDSIQPPPPPAPTQEIPAPAPKTVPSSIVVVFKPTTIATPNTSEAAPAANTPEFETKTTATRKRN